MAVCYRGYEFLTLRICWNSILTVYLPEISTSNWIVVHINICSSEFPLHNSLQTFRFPKTVTSDVFTALIPQCSPSTLRESNLLTIRYLFSGKYIGVFSCIYFIST